MAAGVTVAGRRRGDVSGVIKRQTERHMRAGPAWPGLAGNRRLHHLTTCHLIPIVIKRISHIALNFKRSSPGGRRNEENKISRDKRHNTNLKPPVQNGTGAVNQAAPAHEKQIIVGMSEHGRHAMTPPATLESERLPSRYKMMLQCREHRKSMQQDERYRVLLRAINTTWKVVGRLRARVTVESKAENVHWTLDLLKQETVDHRNKRIRFTLLYIICRNTSIVAGVHAAIGEIQMDEIIAALLKICSG
ncbi:unnamed protein product [Danaus chrysippus]|uniref:(African queen) hypothetical protein n=1 Tax=Danaus chrysippus TaxID=151541 RepID=A0A8J2VXE5_9NEOP|nr:unnamed protein product [Danaus chrysippus]